MIDVVDAVIAVLFGVIFLGLAVAAVWLIREDVGPDIDAMREARRRDGRGAL